MANLQNVKKSPFSRSNTTYPSLWSLSKTSVDYVLNTEMKTTQKLCNNCSYNVTGSDSYTLGSNCLMQDWLQECVTHSHTPSASWHLGFSFIHTHLSCHRRQKGFDSATLPNITFISNKSLLRGKKPLNFVHSYKGGNI